MVHLFKKVGLIFAHLLEIFSLRLALMACGFSISLVMFGAYFVGSEANVYLGGLFIIVGSVIFMLAGQVVEIHLYVWLGRGLIRGIKRIRAAFAIFP